jgi:hypothetical protein
MSQLNSLLISLPLKRGCPLGLLAERENEAGKSGLFLFEKCIIKMLFFMSNFSITKKVAGKANPVFGPGRSKANLRNDGVVQEPDYDPDGVPTTIK